MDSEMSNDIFKPGTEVRMILYNSIRKEDIESIVSSALELLATSPVTTKGPGVDFEVRLNDIQTEFDDLTNEYCIIGIGVVI